MSVILRVTNVWLFIDGDMPNEIRDEIRDRLSFYVPNFQHLTLYKQLQEKAATLGQEPEWDGRKTVARIVPGGSLRCPTGLVSMIREILVAHQVPYVVQDERAPEVKSPGWSIEGFELRDYQKDIEEKGLLVKRGVMWASTGSGKTKCVCSMITKAASFPAVFYVPSCDLLKQAHSVLSKHIRHNGNPVTIGRIGAGHFDIQPITVATVQSCQQALEGVFTKFDDESDDDDKTEFAEAQKKAIREMIAEAQFIYVDECQHTSAQTIQTVMNNSYKARFRYGGSASPWRDDGLDLLIEACFGKRFCKVDASYLIRRGFLIKPHIIFNHFQQFLGRCANYKEHYTRFVVENDARNRWIAERAHFHLERNRPTIILVKWARHAEILKDLIPEAEVLTSSGKMKKSPEKRRLILDDMRERKVMCIIGTSLLDEGIDIPAAGAGIFAGAGKSSTRALQRVGRIIRPDANDPGKQTAYIEEIYDHCKWLMHHARLRREIYATEPEFEILDNRSTMTL